MKVQAIANVIEETSVNLVRLAVTKLPQDVKEALQNAYREETSRAGKVQLEVILKNIELAEEENTPMCQDTGTITYCVKAGSQTQGLDKIEPVLRKATKKASREILFVQMQWILSLKGTQEITLDASYPT